MANEPQGVDTSGTLSERLRRQADRLDHTYGADPEALRQAADLLDDLMWDVRVRLATSKPTQVQSWLHE